MAIRRNGNMTPSAGIRKPKGHSFSKGGKKAARKYACGGKLKK